MGRKIDQDKTAVTWIPEENCYRTVEQTTETVTIGGVEQAFDVAVFGDKVQWVDDAPGSVEDGSGHFATYTGDDDAYTPVKTTSQEG